MIKTFIKHDENNYFLIKRKILYGLLITQILLYLTVPGDCGDVACNSGSTFIERLTRTTLFSSGAGYDIAGLLFLIYLLIFLLLLINLLRNTK